MLHMITNKLKLSETAERILFDISLVTLVASMIFGFIIIFWLLQPSKILTINNEPIPEAFDGVRAGRSVVFIINYCKVANNYGKVEWEMVGSSSITILPPYIDMTQKSCNKHLLDPVIIPPQTPPGTYYIVWKVTYEVNPLKQDYIEFRSRDFTVVKAK